MIIYTSTKVVPYVYICIHKETKQFYIGSRYTTKLKLPSHLDFPAYKTSAPYIKENSQLKQEVKLVNLTANLSK